MRVVLYAGSYGVGTIPAFAHDNIHIFSEKCKELGIRDNYVLNPSHFEKGQVKEIVNCILLLAFLGKNKNMESALHVLVLAEEGEEENAVNDLLHLTLLEVRGIQDIVVADAQLLALLGEDVNVVVSKRRNRAYPITPRV